MEKAHSLENNREGGKDSSAHDGGGCRESLLMAME